MQVPGNDVLDIVLDLDDTAIQEIITPTARKEAGQDLTDEEIERQSGLEVPPAEPEPAAEEPVKKMRPKDYRRSAESITLAVDFLFQTAMPFALEFKALSAEERRIVGKNIRIFKLRKKSEDKGISREFPFFDENEDYEELYQRWAAILEFCEDEMPLDDDEAEKVTDAWAKILEFYQKEPGPWPHLIITLVAIYGKRITPVFVI